MVDSYYEKAINVMLKTLNELMINDVFKAIDDFSFYIYYVHLNTNMLFRTMNMFIS